MDWLQAALGSGREDSEFTAPSLPQTGASPGIGHIELV